MAAELTRWERALLRPLRLAVSLEPNLRALAIRRFSDPFYSLRPRSRSADALFAPIAPIAGALVLLANMKPVRAAGRIGLVIEGGDETHWERYFERIAAEIQGVPFRRAGTGPGFDQPPAPGVAVEPLAAIRAALALIILAPYLLLVSLVTNRNIGRASVRSIVTYLRARRYFKQWPSRLFLTYKDNQCSAAFYAGFHDAGGEELHAIQNGVRFAIDGLDGSCFDHLFALGDAYERMYRDAGGRVEAATTIGSLRLATGFEQLDPTPAIEFDVLAIDQGPPDASAQHWGTLPPVSAELFLRALRSLANAHPELAIAYQLRCYSPDEAHLERSLQRCFAGARIRLLDGCRPMAAYQNVLRSRLVVTMNSTLGLESFVLGRPALFVNFTGDAQFNVVPPPLSLSANSDEDFIGAVLRGLRSPDAERRWTDFVGQNTFIGAGLIGERLRRSLDG